MCVEQVIRSSNGLFRIFQKAPAPTGAFWFLQFVNLHRRFPANKTVPDSNMGPPLFALQNPLLSTS
ncbi:hypothetical protein KPSA1_07360 [Pseudomonas syringae pv. actinidiae]|uniref:Uncharacterized protein n=1 Tax=Pseudomonas syringae pv. actinidiae TaxID=103796 RepID=A0A2V0QL68_PSESF|nr:hypothetical protein KPSA1_07360 [Pseudomonas syringae pv. actinidiae]